MTSLLVFYYGGDYRQRVVPEHVIAIRGVASQAFLAIYLRLFQYLAALGTVFHAQIILFFTRFMELL